MFWRRKGRKNETAWKEACVPVLLPSSTGAPGRQEEGSSGSAVLPSRLRRGLLSSTLSESDGRFDQARASGSSRASPGQRSRGCRGQDTFCLASASADAVLPDSGTRCGGCRRGILVVTPSRTPPEGSPTFLLMAAEAGLAGGTCIFWGTGPGR